LKYLFNQYLLVFLVKMGCSQVVRQRILDPPYEGSIPSIPITGP
jgi:hypothetical protein